MSSPSKKDRRPICTIRSCMKTPVTQPLYVCHTCKFKQYETICKNCAEFCHVNHDVGFIGNKIGYCWCGYGCRNCHCFLEHPVDGDMSLPPDCPRQCLFNQYDGNNADMEGHQCDQCGISFRSYCCTPCFHMCHKGHSGLDPDGSNSHTSQPCCCGDPSGDYPCKIKPPKDVPEPIPLCTYAICDAEYISQKTYICLTCNQKDNTCVCEFCARVCHAGHQLVEINYISSYCDCGAHSPAAHCHCKLMDFEPAQ
ncbi:Zinc finger in N-recognin family protein [Trichomonas vaginalis G3]|uniref:Zinc finger in N-recognin family protein n=1 Tax=Trichomonas vaginalis (strain ATCC PRA-98 / G3) TaxID=412133 RepID=A2E3M0_TRIV3|nr:perineurial glial growth protein family [Trichomonas vaginalis G3]EAY12786.1 Zinc finger in N-recognin family protein [Trichomonas vaginalis G3]KAI5505591.1 perineurial glial growth protein family [Trichomonas vaginalis G3]|eukprot:XP_001325009.1 Zinc finger in N-recognin family protein [Trichomonas vaginalis G3]